jgi:hypothetical protein
MHQLASSASNKQRAVERSSIEVDMMERENKKMDLELKKFELEAIKFDADIELKREQQHQLMTFHKEEMELKRKIPTYTTPGGNEDEVYGV